MLYDRFKILRNAPHANIHNEFKLWSVACINDYLYVLNDNNIYLYYEIRHLNYNVV